MTPTKSIEPECGEVCCTHGCNQGRNCPIRKARIERVAATRFAKVLRTRRMACIKEMAALLGVYIATLTAGALIIIFF